MSAGLVLAVGLGWVLYGTLLCGAPRGQTVGMMAVRVRVVREGSGDRLGYRRALGRAALEGFLRLVNFIFTLLGLVWALDMLFPLWDDRRQTLHDKAVGSVVVRVAAGG